MADEFDDAVGALRHVGLKLTAEVGRLWHGTRALLAGVGMALKYTPRRRRAPR